jgi:hypothetical protein
LRLLEANPTAALRFQKRAKGTHHTTADQGPRLLALQSEPLRLPEANPAASLRFQTRKRAKKPHHHTTVDDSEGLLATSLLGFLKQMDCTRDAELLRLQGLVQCSMSCEFPLCTEIIEEDGAVAATTKVEYVLKVGGGGLGTTVGADPTARPGQPPLDELVRSLGVLAFCLDARTFKRMVDNDVRRPGYLVALGEVYMVNRSRDRGHEVAATGFFVLMEVSSRRKSLWMVYRYETRFDREGPIEFHDQRESLFMSIPGAFDTVCLLDDIRDWKSTAEDMISMDRFPEALSDGDFDILRPTFCTPELPWFRAAIRKGWE